MQTISFSEKSGAYVSDIITASADSMVLQIQFELGKSGRSVLERSIDGENWTMASMITPYPFRDKTYEVGISGIVVGQKLRVKFDNGVMPKQINILQQ